jgi:hypothetical protein
MQRLALSKYTQSASAALFRRTTFTRPKLLVVQTGVVLVGPESDGDASTGYAPVHNHVFYRIMMITIDNEKCQPCPARPACNCLQDGQPLAPIRYRLAARRVMPAGTQPSLVGMGAGGCRVLVGLLAVLVRSRGVLLGFLVLAQRMVMLGLVVVMRRGVMVSGRLVVVLARRMCRCLCHLDGPFRSVNGRSRHSLVSRAAAEHTAAAPRRQLGPDQPVRPPVGGINGGPRSWREGSLAEANEERTRDKEAVPWRTPPFGGFALAQCPGAAWGRGVGLTPLGDPVGILVPSLSC